MLESSRNTIQSKWGTYAYNLHKACQTLLRFMLKELWPVYQPFVDLFQGLLIVGRQLPSLPKLRRHVRSLDCLHIQIDGAVGSGPNSRICRH